MSAFLEGISRSFCIWPKTDYNKFIPKRSPSVDAWSNVGKNLANSVLKYDRMLEEREIGDEALSNARNDSFKSYFYQHLDSSDISTVNKKHFINIVVHLKEFELEKDSLLNEISELKIQLQKLENELKTEVEESKDNND
ncbi:hypothetical protein LJ779_001220 [Vibrio parahaemolyticus]|nr:hypothetical protein [Vibrio parahaemolyticus]